MRVAEASEKEAADLEEETKLKLEEADRQKQDVDEKLVQCLARETRVIDDLQKLKVGNQSFLFIWKTQINIVIPQSNKWAAISNYYYL